MEPVEWAAPIWRPTCSNFLSRSAGIVLMIRTPGFAVLPRCYRLNARRALKVLNSTRANHARRLRR